MKKQLFLVSLSLLGLVMVTNAQGTASKSNIVKGEAKAEKAVVFLNGAELTQKASINLQKGENEVRIEGLSTQLDQSSLKVKLANGAVVSRFEYSTDYLTNNSNPAAQKSLQDSLDIYKNQLSTVKQQLETNQQMQELLKKGIDNSMSGDKQISSEQIEKNLAYFQQREGKLLTEQNELQTKEKKLNERISNLQSQIRQDGTKNSKRSGVLSMTVLAARTGATEVQISYFTTKAKWEPMYDVVVAGKDKPIDLNLKAKVRQTTGIDWNSIRLTLSTGTPSRNNQVPQLSTWFLSRQYEQPRYVASANYAARASAKVAMAEKPMMDMMVEEESTAEANKSMGDYIAVQEQALSVEYAIDLPYSILGNGKEQTISLVNKQATDVTYKYMSVPKLDRAVYLTAAINNYNDLSLLSAQANLTVGDTYYGQTWLNSTNTDDKLKLTLGEDAALNIKREKIADKSKTSGKDTQRTLTYRLTIRNNKREAVMVSLQEPYPVSTAKDIVVELSEKSSQWTENNTEKGILKYEIELGAGESKEIDVCYTIKYPKDWKINL